MHAQIHLLLLSLTRWHPGHTAGGGELAEEDDDEEDEGALLEDDEFVGPSSLGAHDLVESEGLGQLGRRQKHQAASSSRAGEEEGEGDAEEEEGGGTEEEGTEATTDSEGSEGGSHSFFCAAETMTLL